MKQNRDILKEFVKEHSEQLNYYQMREGDLERFKQKVENASGRKNRWSFWAQGRVVLASAAVCIIAVLFVAVGIKFPGRTRDLSDSEITLAERTMILELKAKAALIISENAGNQAVSEEELKNSMESLLNDPVLISEQLSDELSPKEKVKIIKEYYNQKLEGLGQFRTMLASAEKIDN